MARTSQSPKAKPAAKDLHLAVTQYIAQQKTATFNYKQVSAAIGAETPAAQKAVAMILAEMAFDGDIIEVTPGKYKAPQRSNVTTGTFVRRSNGKNSVIMPSTATR